MTFDRGRPLHVFDAAKGARQSHGAPRQGGENLLALDGVRTNSTTRCA